MSLHPGPDTSGDRGRSREPEQSIPPPRRSRRRTASQRYEAELLINFEEDRPLRADSSACCDAMQGERRLARPYVVLQETSVLQLA